MQAILLKPSRVWTANFDIPRENLTVLVRGDTIAAVDRADAIKDEAVLFRENTAAEYSL